MATLRGMAKDRIGQKPPGLSRKLSVRTQFLAFLELLTIRLLDPAAFQKLTLEQIIFGIAPLTGGPAWATRSIR